MEAQAPNFDQSSLFTESARELGIDFVHFNGMSGRMYMLETIGSGVALFDYDGDGDLDAYLVQGGIIDEDSIARAPYPPRHPPPFTDRLYRNDLHLAADGSTVTRFVDVTERSELAAYGYGMGIATGDVDNDGWIDVYVTNFGSNQLLKNDGDGTFSDATATASADDPRWGVSAALFDYDRDGWLDLFVGNYVDFDLAIHQLCSSPMGQRDYCGPLVYPAARDGLFHNRGDGTFENVSLKSGINTEYGAALGVVASDFNGDGRLDIYVANDHMPNQLWMSQSDGTFINDAMFAGCAVNSEGKPEASMGVVVGDINGDGHDDIFLTHITAETNTLYLNDGRGLFQDSTRSSGLGMVSWKYTGFGTALFDYDNDGWQDLFIANGTVQIIEELAAEGDPLPLRQPNLLFHALGQGRFEDVTPQSGVADGDPAVSRGTAVGDIENDGDPDLLVSNNAERAELLVNQTGSARSWIGLVLTGGSPRRDMLSTRVAARLPDGRMIWRRSATDGSYASANDPRILLGLDRETSVESLRAFWPDGSITEWRDLPSGRYIHFQR